jgi:hypothetical protein
MHARRFPQPIGWVKGPPPVASWILKKEKRSRCPHAVIEINRAQESIIKTGSGVNIFYVLDYI